MNKRDKRIILVILHFTAAFGMSVAIHFGTVQNWKTALAGYGGAFIFLVSLVSILKIINDD